MSGRTIARILLVAFLVLAAVGIGVSAYNAGVAAGIAHEGTVVVQPGGYPVAPYAGWGPGWGWGFPFVWFFGGLFFLFLLFGLIRAAFGGPRWGRGYGRGWSGSGWTGGGWTDDQVRSWEQRARETHDAWHRAHPESNGPGSAGPGSTGAGPSDPSVG
jgi:hypothetical protein